MIYVFYFIYYYLLFIIILYFNFYILYIIRIYSKSKYTKMTSKVKVVSWNILASEWITKNNYPDITTKLLFNHKQRIKTIIEKLKNYNSDIILLQEVMPDEYKIIQKHFKGEYTVTPIQSIKWTYKNTHTNKNESGNVILLRITNYSNIKIYSNSKNGLKAPILRI